MACRERYRDESDVERISFPILTSSSHVNQLMAMICIS